MQHWGRMFLRRICRRQVYFIQLYGGVHIFWYLPEFSSVFCVHTNKTGILSRLPETHKRHYYTFVLFPHTQKHIFFFFF